jgi:hypothetical protein
MILFKWNSSVKDINSANVYNVTALNMLISKVNDIKG